jgi:hypothetical protein
MADERGRTYSLHGKVRAVFKISVAESEGKTLLRRCVPCLQLTNVYEASNSAFEKYIQV